MKRKPTISHTHKVQWFARAGLVARMGPYETQVAAVEACRLRQDGRWHIQPDGDAAYCCSSVSPVSRFSHLARTGDFYDNTFVWPEEVPVEPKKRRSDECRDSQAAPGATTCARSTRRRGIVSAR